MHLAVERRRVDLVEARRRLLSLLLTSVGFEVAEAVDGREAVERALAWRPDLIFMDIRMPVMDGYEATRRIRESETKDHGRSVIVGLTASAFEHDREAIIELRKTLYGILAEGSESETGADDETGTDGDRR